MNLVILSALVIALLIVFVVLSFSMADVRRLRTEEGAEYLVAIPAAPVGASYLVMASTVSTTGPVGVGYMDEGYQNEPTPAPATTGPVGVGYMDEGYQNEPTPAAAPAPVGVGYLDEPTTPPTPAPARAPEGTAPVGVGYLDV